MVKQQNLNQITQDLWKLYSKKKRNNKIKWLKFCKLLFNKQINEVPEHLTKFIPKNLDMIGTVDNIIIMLLEEDNKKRNLSRVSNDFKFLLLNELRKYSKIIIITSLKDIIFSYHQASEGHTQIKIIRFPKGIIPNYFIDLIEKYREASSIELMAKITDISALEDSFINNDLIPNIDSDVDAKKKIILYTLLLILLSKVNNISSFFKMVMNRNKRKFFYSEILYIIQEQYKELNFNLEVFKEIKSILNGFVKETFFTDINILKELAEKYSFSIQEPSSLSLEIAITPYILSSIVEKSLEPLKYKKKKGKFYTLMHDAEFIVKLALYRILSQKAYEIDSTIIFNALFHFTSLRKDEFEKKDRLPFNIEELEILDPACGSGTFLYCITRILWQLTSTYNLIKINKVKLWGNDLDNLAIFITQIRIILFKETVSAEKDKFPFNLDINNIKSKNFFHSNFKSNFDLIIGNPPYVRHEDISSLGHLDYKNHLQKHLDDIIGKKIIFDRKSDLYIYFCLKGLTLVKKPGGILAFLISNAWLEVQYGKTLQDFILSPSTGVTSFDVIFRGGSRLWDQLGINTVVFFAEKTENDLEGLKGIFTQSSVDFHEIPYYSLREGIISRVTWEDNYYKTQIIDKMDLTKTNKWAGAFLRSTISERSLIKKISGKGVPLSSIAKVRFGIKTGANDFFHIKRIESKDSAQGTIYIRNRLGFEGDIEKEYLVPLIKNPLEVEGFVIDQTFSPNYYLFLCNDSLSKLKGSRALKYISWAESIPVKVKQGIDSGEMIYGFSSLSSVKKRGFWYSLGSNKPPDLLWTKSYHIKPGCFMNQIQILPDQRFYGIYVKNHEYIPLIFIYLNSSFVWAQMEIQGNTNLGFGVLDTNVYWLKSLKIPLKTSIDMKRVRYLANTLIQTEKRYSMLKSPKIRKLIDEFFSEYYELSDNELIILNSFIVKTISSRIGLNLIDNNLEA